MADNQHQLPPGVLSQDATNEVLALRKLEVLLDCLGQVEQANTPDAYALKLKLLNKIEDVIDLL